MRCVICDHTEWTNVDEYRIREKIGMSICNHCGFVSYPEKWKSKEEILKHYRDSYRRPPTAANIFTGQRKNHYHAKFLADYLTKWKNQKNDESLSFLEIGSAFGMTLHWLKTLFPKANYAGTEITTSFRRVAKHEFGIDLQEDFDRTKKYDLILSYKVAEHQLDIDKELIDYKNCLTPEGRLYISVPTWFDALINFGLSGFDIEYYYDPNHVNVWTKKHFQTLLKKCGLEVVKEDHEMYGSTYLCKRNDNLMKEAPQYEDPKEIKAKMDNIKKAFLLCGENQFQKAIDLWPNYPTAWINHIEMNRKLMAEKGWPWFNENFIVKAIEACPGAGRPEIYFTATDFSMRARDWAAAISYAEASLEMRPESPTSLHQLCNIMREKALTAISDKEKLHWFEQAVSIAKHLRLVSLQHYAEATEMIFKYEAEIPITLASGPIMKPQKVLKTLDQSPEATP